MVLILHTDVKIIIYFIIIIIFTYKLYRKKLFMVKVLNQTIFKFYSQIRENLFTGN